MALRTHSKFYYGIAINEFNAYLEFQDAADPVKVALQEKEYSLAGILEEVLATLNRLGTQVYTGSISRVTRQITISAPGEFTLKTFSGTAKDVSVYSMLGFSLDADYEGSNSYTSDFGVGFEYSPQFPLQSYLDPKHNIKAIEGVTKKSTSGVIEAIRYGTESKVEFDIMFITNVSQDGSTPIRSNDSGVEDAAHFLKYATAKNPVEFMPDENASEEFMVLILESSEADTTGLGFSLIEEYDQGLPEYYRSGKLVWVLQESV